MGGQRIVVKVLPERLLTPMDSASLTFDGVTWLERGAYRNAIIDDITALELEAEPVLRDLVKNTLPAEAIDRITRRYDDVQLWIGYLKGPRLADSPIANAVRIARDTRHLISHRRLPATRQAALEVHSTVADALAWLRST